MKSLKKLLLTGTTFFVTLIPLCSVSMKPDNASAFAMLSEFLGKEEVFDFTFNSRLNEFHSEKNDCRGDKDDEC